MKITDVQAVYPKYVNVPSSWRSSLWQIVIKIETNVGVFGYGFGGGGLASVAIVNNHFKELLIGKNIESKDDISEIWDHLYFESIPYGRKGIAIMALSGVDLALWDLLGKAEGTPVYNLVGTRNKQSVNPMRREQTSNGTLNWGSPHTSSPTGGAMISTTTPRY